MGTLDEAIGARLERMRTDDVVARVWARDHTVWKSDPTEIADRLGWLDVASAMREHAPRLRAFARAAADDGLTHAILFGMCGSSLAPEVFRTTFGVVPGALDLVVLDTTHPAAIARVERTVDLERALFVVASKSGGTIETLSHFHYFFEKVKRGDRFVAITDPGTSLEQLARETGFRDVFLNPPDIGGRYSALSYFGLVHAALIGADVDGLLGAATELERACRANDPRANPGALLGATIGEAALAGLDKLTLVLPREIASFGSWVEQLVAESTGKEGTGVVPVVDEDLGPPEAYGDDRLFVGIGDGPKLDALERAGHRVVRIDEVDPSAFGAHFFLFEFATAIAGYVLGINPFDQPNVAAAKEATQRILDSGERARRDERGDVRALLDAVRPGDYVAIQAFIDPTPDHAERLQRARLAIRDARRVATTVGFGPRYLHSTGQLHKGGPNSGVFIQIVDEARATDMPIPGRDFTFGELIDAQALGDLTSLRALGRRVVRATIEELESGI